MSEAAMTDTQIPRTQREKARTALPRKFEFIRQWLLLTCAVLPPWLFGTTENWAIWTMNALCYGAGVLLVCRFMFLSRPALNIDPRDNVRWLTVTLASLTGFVLLFCIVSAVNARATFVQEQHIFDYHSYIHWLPFTYDRDRTWFVFWTYLGQACFFWCLRDWILWDPEKSTEQKPWEFPPRLRRLLWAISLNTALLALVGIFERLSGTSKMLWLRESWDRTPGSMFASYSFRGNAAQYFNLAWPLMLGTWWTMRQHAINAPTAGFKVGGRPHLVLVPCTILAAAAPILSSSKGGILITLICLGFACIVLLQKPALDWRSRSLIFLLAGSVLLLGAYLNSDAMGPFIQSAFSTKYSNPIEIYENARQMAIDYPVFGIGPGAFRALYQLYRSDPSQGWHAYLHDDWLETRVTFGWVGSIVILCMLALVLARWFVPPGIPSTYEFVALLWVAIGGCLAHAKFSFPLQVYSILQLFLVLCCILFCIARPLPKWVSS
jgi:hypothetical protein